MGLDMYLYRQKRLYKGDDGRVEALWAARLPEWNGNLGVVSIEAEVMYWRKANAIHWWFVRTLASGLDECQRIHANREDLENLLDLCQQVKKETALLGPNLLPTRSGFFFGSMEYDEFYVEDLDRTIEGLSRVLAESEDEKYPEFVYQASW